MKTFVCLFSFVLLITACTTKQNKEAATLPITGTWQLLTGTLIENGDTTVTEYTSKISFIKVINQDHFAFLQHDLNHGQDSSNAVFVAGGGPYTLKDSVYTEHLEYCNDRAWEGHDFSFVVTVKNDTLIQKGLEVIEEQGVNRMNVEVYKRL
jgi:hypothetical protein